MRILRLLALPFLLSGCLARTAVDIVTLPVKVVGAGVDAATTSQAEADQRRGREMREEEERAAARPAAASARPRRERDAPGEDEEEPEAGTADAAHPANKILRPPRYGGADGGLEQTARSGSWPRPEGGLRSAGLFVRDFRRARGRAGGKRRARAHPLARSMSRPSCSCVHLICAAACCSLIRRRGTCRRRARSARAAARARSVACGPGSAAGRSRKLAPHVATRGAAALCAASPAPCGARPR